MSPYSASQALRTPENGQLSLLPSKDPIASNDTNGNSHSESALNAIRRLRQARSGERVPTSQRPEANGFVDVVREPVRAPGCRCTSPLPDGDRCFKCGHSLNVPKDWDTQLNGADTEEAAELMAQLDRMAQGKVTGARAAGRSTGRMPSYMDGRTGYARS